MQIKRVIQLACQYCDGVIFKCITVHIGHFKDSSNSCLIMNSKIAIFAYRTLLQSNQRNNLPLKWAIVLFTGSFLFTCNNL